MTKQAKNKKADLQSVKGKNKLPKSTAHGHPEINFHYQLTPYELYRKIKIKIFIQPTLHGFTQSFA